MKRVYAREEVCIGCRLCEIHCLVAHSRSKDIITAFKKETPRAAARCLVEEAGPVSLAVQCRHCDDPPCVSACMTGAMSKSEAGAVTHDKERCVGCWMCIMVCPYGAVRRDRAAGKVAGKCDLCADTLEAAGEPACVAACPNGALTFEDRTLATGESGDGSEGVA